MSTTCSRLSNGSKKPPRRRASSLHFRKSAAGQLGWRSTYVESSSRRLLASRVIHSCWPACHHTFVLSRPDASLCPSVVHRRACAVRPGEQTIANASNRYNVERVRTTGTDDVTYNSDSGLRSSVTSQLSLDLRLTFVTLQSGYVRFMVSGQRLLFSAEADKRELAGVGPPSAVSNPNDSARAQRDRFRRRSWS